MEISGVNHILNANIFKTTYLTAGKQESLKYMFYFKLSY